MRVIGAKWSGDPGLESETQPLVLCRLSRSKAPVAHVSTTCGCGPGFCARGCVASFTASVEPGSKLGDNPPATPVGPTSHQWELGSMGYEATSCPSCCGRAYSLHWGLTGGQAYPGAALGAKSGVCLSSQQSRATSAPAFRFSSSSSSCFFVLQLL